MQIRTVAAALNGILVLALDVAAWGVPSFTVALLEVGLAVAAALSTSYALRKASVPIWMLRFASRITGRHLPV